MKKKIKSIFTVSIIAIFTSIIILVNLFIWITKEPKSFNFIKPYIEKELNYLNKNFDLRIGEGHIKWSKDIKKLFIEVKSIKLSSKQNNNVVLLRNISFELNLFRLVAHKLFNNNILVKTATSNVYVKKAELYVDNNSLKSHKEKPIEKKIFLYVYEILGTSINNFISYSLNIEETTLHIKNINNTKTLKISDIKLTSNKKGDKSIIKCTLKAHLSNVNESKISITAVNFAQKELSVSISFSNLISYHLYKLFPNFKLFKNFNINASGNIEFVVDKDLSIPQLNVYIEKANGTLEKPKILDIPLHFKNINLVASIYNNKVLTISRMSGLVNSYPFNFNSKLVDYKLFSKENRQIEETKQKSLGKSEEELYRYIYPDISLYLYLKNFKENDLKEYIPIGFKNNILNFVTNNIKNGIFSTLKINLNISRNDIYKMLQLTKKSKKGKENNIPKDIIDVKLKFKNTDVIYSSKLPKLSNTSGSLEINANHLEGSLYKGKILNNELNNFKFSINDFWKDTTKLNAFTRINNGKIKDVMHIIDLSLGNNNNNSNVVKNIFNATGSIKGFLRIEKPMKKKFIKKGINIYSNIESKNCTIPKILNNHSVTCKDIKLSFKNNSLFINGTAKVLNKIFDINLVKKFSKTDNDNRMKYRVKGALTAKDLKKLDLGKIPYNQGNIYIDVIIDKGDKNISLLGQAFLDQTSINFKKFGFYKKTNIPARLLFKGSSTKKSPLSIEYFKLTGKDTEIEGNFYFNKNYNVQEANFNTIKYSNNDIKAYYKEKNKSLTLNVTGKSLDYKAMDIFSTDDENSLNLTDVDINLDIKKILMSNNEVFRNTKLKIQCVNRICNNIEGDINLSDNIETNKKTYKPNKVKGFFHMESKNISKQRKTLYAYSNNASAIIKGLNLYDNINGGNLELKTVFKNIGTNTLAKGLLEINDINLTKAPFIAKVLLLPSFRGILNLLKKEGIKFKNVKIPFVLSKKIISIKGARTYHSSMGITSEGIIDTHKNFIDFKGTIIPADTLNKVVGSIPILGKIITGTNNQGFLAATYKVKGKFKDVKTSVNPLSVLSIGFIKDIFDLNKIQKGHSLSNKEINILKGVSE